MISIDLRRFLDYKPFLCDNEIMQVDLPIAGNDAAFTG